MEKIPQGQSGASRDIAADKMDVNPHYVSDAKKLKKASKKKFAQVKAGKKSLAKAKKELPKVFKTRKAAKEVAEQLKRPPRGGLAAQKAEFEANDLPESFGKFSEFDSAEAARQSAPSHHQSNGQCSCLEKLDAFWKENSRRLSEYPAAQPGAVWNQLRKVLA